MRGIEEILDTEKIQKDFRCLKNSEIFSTSFLCDDVIKLAKQYKVEQSQENRCAIFGKLKMTDFQLFVGVQYTRILLHVGSIKPDENSDYYRREVYNRTDNCLRAWSHRK